MKRYNDKGFTLVEMMVILFIIAVLSALAAPNMKGMFTRNKLRASTTSVTSSLYLARMKSINDGEQYGVEFHDDGSFQMFKDPYGTNEEIGTPFQLQDGISFGDISFMDWLAVFNEQGQLHKDCLPEGEYTGFIKLSDGAEDSTMVEITMISGRIRETNR